MELYVPTHQLKHVSDILTEEKVTFQVTDKKSILTLEGKEAFEVTEVTGPAAGNRGPGGGG